LGDSPLNTPCHKKSIRFNAHKDSPEALDLATIIANKRNSVQPVELSDVNQKFMYSVQEPSPTDSAINRANGNGVRFNEESDKFFGTMSENISPILGTDGSNNNKSIGVIGPKKSINKISKKPDWMAYVNLDLTLEEIVHIRTVHTKIELEENRNLKSSLKEEVERGRICFLCMKNSFGIFVWSYQCKLCLQYLCSTCIAEIKIPIEHFSKIHINTLANGDEEEKKASSFSSTEENSRRVSLEEKEPSPASLPLTSTPTSTKVKLRRANTVILQRGHMLKRSELTQVNVCLDCKEIIGQILRFQRSSTRQQLTRSLCLN